MVAPRRHKCLAPRRRRWSCCTVWQKMQLRLISFRCTSHFFACPSVGALILCTFSLAECRRSKLHSTIMHPVLAVATSCTAQSRVFFSIRQDHLHRLFDVFSFFRCRTRFEFLPGRHRFVFPAAFRRRKQVTPSWLLWLASTWTFACNGWVILTSVLGGALSCTPPYRSSAPGKNWSSTFCSLFILPCALAKAACRCR